jgi:hypothetical protein
LERAGFRVPQTLEIGSEWRESREETTGQTGSCMRLGFFVSPIATLASSARMRTNVLLGDCYWHI